MDHRDHQRDSAILRDWKCTFTVTKPRPVDFIHDHFPETAHLDWPQRSEKGLITSLAYHGSIHKVERLQPSDEILQRSVDKAVHELEKGLQRRFKDGLEEALPGGTSSLGLPGCFAGADGPKTVEEFQSDILLSTRLLLEGVSEFRLLPDLVLSIDDCIDDSDPDSTPGIPLNYYGSKKSTWCEDRRSLILLVLDRLNKMLNFDFTSTTGSQLVKALVCDPIYTFIKDEPHKREKLDKGRFRIISGVSLVDNLIERLLFSKLNKLEIELNEYIPYKPGMGLHDQGQEALYSWFIARQAEYKLCSTDVSGWDWSVPLWLLLLDLMYRSRFCAGSKPWFLLAKARFQCMALKVFQLPSGKMFEQLIACILPSGSYLTSSTNSHMRLMLSIIVQLLLGVDEECEAEGCQMGDDALERYLEGMMDVYIQLGFTVKGVDVKPPNEFSFCSTHWEGRPHGEPESWAKTLFRFLHKNVSDPLYETYRLQFIRDIRHHPGKEDLIARVDAFKAEFG